jgi:hypothetical protein
MYLVLYKTIVHSTNFHLISFYFLSSIGRSLLIPMKKVRMTMMMTMMMMKKKVSKKVIELRIGYKMKYGLIIALKIFYSLEQFP